MKKVAVIMGSRTDLKVMRDAVRTLKKFGVSAHIEVVSAHRTPDAMAEFGREAAKKYSLIIAGAGGAAHLPGMVASHTTLPVIGVPITVGSLKGLDALLSIAQMPKGIPVATVAVDNACNAALLAIRILAVEEKSLRRKLDSWASKNRQKVAAMNRSLRRR